ncbi:MAG: universal stress protein [Dehalococcoidia bacterium]
MIRRILVPLDGSELAESILGYVVEIGRRSGASVLLLAAAHQETAWGEEVPADHIGRQVALAQDYLEMKRKELEAKGLQVAAEVVRKPAAEAILDRADADHVDLIAMSTHGRSGVTRWVFGSVADKVLHDTHRPLLLIRPPQEAEAGEQPPPIRRILVPLDGSSVAESVLPSVEALAKPLKASLILFQAVTPMTPISPATVVPPQLPRVAEAVEELHTEAEQYLSRIAKELERQRLKTKTVVNVDFVLRATFTAVYCDPAEGVLVGVAPRAPFTELFPLCEGLLMPASAEIEPPSEIPPGGCSSWRPRGDSGPVGTAEELRRFARYVPYLARVRAYGVLVRR